MQRRHLLAAPALLAVPPARAEAVAPVLVELFTSQGCSSCPRADAALARLTARDDVLALAYHVTYWDRLGWRDTLGDARFDARQRWYDGLLGTGSYTPQAVVAGEIDLVGSDPRLEQAIGIARSNRTPARIAVSGATATLPALALPSPARVTVVAFAPRQRVHIERGENAGADIEYVNAVRTISEINAWDGVERTLDLRPAAQAGAGVAVIAQDPASGRIHAVGRSNAS
ncbi:MAG: DUF1223 domain-containing protein [Geminicoccaceae bacterium]